MVPSMRIESPGRSLGKTSASIEVSNSTGALGYAPRMAWLPMTTMSVVSVLAAAARMMCSSCARFTGVEFAQNEISFLRCNDAAGRTRLPEPRGVLIGGFELSKERLSGPFHEPLPFEQNWSDASRAGGQPSSEICLSLADQIGVRANFFGNETGEGKAALVDEAVVSHGEERLRKGLAMLFQ